MKDETNVPTAEGEARCEPQHEPGTDLNDATEHANAVNVDSRPTARASLYQWPEGMEFPYFSGKSDDGQPVWIKRLTHYFNPYRSSFARHVALVDPADWEALKDLKLIESEWEIARDRDWQWVVKCLPHLRSSRKKYLLTIARVILRATPDQVVSYGKGGKFDLRRSNIRLSDIDRDDPDTPHRWPEKNDIGLAIAASRKFRPWE